MNDSELYLERLVDALFACDCTSCIRDRTARLLRDLELAYNCTTVAEVEARLKRMD